MRVLESRAPRPLRVPIVFSLFFLIEKYNDNARRETFAAPAECIAGKARGAIANSLEHTSNNFRAHPSAENEMARKSLMRVSNENERGERRQKTVEPPSERTR